MKESTFEYAEDLISKAMMFAIAAHSGQKRKDGRTPAIVHAMEAAVNAAALTPDPEVMAAALLHDTVEDTDVTPEQVKKMFGERISALVSSETEDKHPEMNASDSWLLRKQESLDELRAATDPAVKILWLSDKLSNLRSFWRIYREVGDKMWERFHQKDPAMHAFYYREIARALADFKDTAPYEEYIELYHKLFPHESEAIL